jgi:hypothetical protein
MGQIRDGSNGTVGKQELPAFAGRIRPPSTVFD